MIVLLLLNMLLVLVSHCFIIKVIIGWIQAIIHLNVKFTISLLWRNVIFLTSFLSRNEYFLWICWADAPSFIQDVFSQKNDYLGDKNSTSRRKKKNIHIHYFRCRLCENEYFLSEGINDGASVNHLLPIYFRIFIKILKIF